MKMLSDVVEFAGVQSLVAKATGKPFELVAFGDSKNYEKYEFFKRDSLNIQGLQDGQKVKLELEVSKRGFANQFERLSRSFGN